MIILGKLYGKIVLTGGPCAGKTTAISKIEEELTSLGYYVIIIPESATELINSGIKPFGNSKIDLLNFQKLILNYQLGKENFYQQAIKLLDKDTKCIIICDRGALDNQAYITKEQFNEVIKEFGYTRISLLNRYDMILHLVTAADGKEEYYTLENNSARTETIEEARELDKKTLNAQIGHNYLKVFNNEGNFEEKLEKCLTAIQEFLGNPISIRRERKFLINPIKSDLSLLATYPHTTTNIEQYYLKPNYYHNYEKRLRKITYQEGENYYCTIQRRTKNGTKEIIKDSKITKEEFYNMLNTTSIISEVKKTRIVFIYNKQYFRLDIFANNPNIILEIEATKENQEVDIPNFLNIIKDITNDSSYQNINISQPKTKKLLKLN